MQIDYCELKKDGNETDDSFKTAQGIAAELQKFLNRADVRERIRNAETPGTSSLVIQQMILPGVDDLGFEPEQLGIFANCASSRLRPDYFHKDAGILLEVERGKTLNEQHGPS